MTSPLENFGIKHWGAHSIIVISQQVVLQHCFIIVIFKSLYFVSQCSINSLQFNHHYFTGSYLVEYYFTIKPDTIIFHFRVLSQAL